MRIVFMGTPEFAVPSLEALIGNGYDVIGVITQPDRPAGRGNKLTPSPVKQCALQHNIPVYQFERLRRREGRECLESLRPDLCVTAAFGQILSPRLLAVPTLGTVNVHASLLPAYRGSAPINWCLYYGEKTTGVTTMMTNEGMDTGDILLQSELPVESTDTAGTLTEKLSLLGAKLLIETLQELENGTCPRKVQDEDLASYQPMLTKELALIDWSLPAQTVVDRIRAFNPWPGAYTQAPEGTLKIWQAEAVDSDDAAVPGCVLTASAKQGLIIRCGEGALRVLEMQMPGGKRMQAKAYLAGKTIPQGTVFTGGAQ